MEKKRVLLVNAHWSNHGDEAALLSIIQQILLHKPEVDVTVVIKDKKEIKNFPTVQGHEIAFVANQFLPSGGDLFVQMMTKGKYGKNGEMKRFFSLLNAADYIIYAPGGSVINDRFWWKKQLEFLLPFWYAQRYQKPFYVASPSIGPFEKKRVIRNVIRRALLLKTKNLFVREERSYEYLREIGAEKNAQITIDSAFCSRIEDVARLQEILAGDVLLDEFLKKYNKVIGITITELDWNVKYLKSELSQSIFDAMQRFFDYVGQADIGIVLIPQLFGNQDDRTLLERYAKDRKQVFVLSEKYSAEFQQYLISKLYMVVGMRYHSNIFAAKMGIPFLPIVYEEKMDSFLREAQLEEYALDVNEINGEKLCRGFDKIEAEYEKYRIRLQKHRKIWVARAGITKDSLKKFLQ